jgi:hypothetical protein
MVQMEVLRLVNEILIEFLIECLYCRVYCYHVHNRGENLVTEAEQFLKAYTTDASFFNQQPGFISTELRRGKGSSVFYNYAVPEPRGTLRVALNKPELESSFGKYPLRLIHKTLVLLFFWVVNLIYPRAFRLCARLVIQLR